MEEVKLWFEPLLWIAGTVVALGGFIRFFKPVWDFIQSPTKINEQLKQLDAKVDTSLKQLDEKVNTSLQQLDEKVAGHFGDYARTLDQISFDLEKLKKEIQDLREKSEMNDSGTESLLRDRILQSHRYIMTKDYIGRDEYESISAMFRAYKDLGGNMFVDRLMADINTKEIRPLTVSYPTH